MSAISGSSLITFVYLYEGQGFVFFKKIIFFIFVKEKWDLILSRLGLHVAMATAQLRPFAMAS